MTSLQFFNRLYTCSRAWQERMTKRSLPEVVDKVVEETGEYFQAESRVDQLDEIGDVLVCALRAITILTPNEREFIAEMMEMKVRRRIGDGDGVKDKEVEARLRKASARKWRIS